MESLRWILLAAGIVFVVVIYFFGRSRRQNNHSMVEEFEDDLPEFSAQSLDDVDEGVGQVKIISSDLSSLAQDDELQTDFSANGSPESDRQENSTSKNTLNDIIVLYILPKPEQTLAGAQINSSAQAMGLSFGEMNIFHYMDGTRSVFSLANMLEPGSFDADTIHDLKTTGLTVFMQMHVGDPLDDLTEMLQRSYQLAGLLDARLCNHKRKPLTEQDAENYRTQVSDFSASKAAAETSELSTET